MKFYVSPETVQALRAGKYRKDMPDFYALKNIVENNAWHLQQPVLDHSLLSADKLLEALTGKALPLRARVGFDSFLSKEIDGVAAAELFKIAVLLHDIGKITTLETQPDGSTWCPGHAEVGATLVPNYSDSFGMTPGQAEYISEIVRLHMVPFEQLGEGLADDDTAKHLALVRTQSEAHYPELLVLAYADMSGCALPDQTVDNYETRVDIIKQELENYFSA